MRLAKLNISWLHEWPATLPKDTCVLLPGAMLARPETSELPRELAAPAAILCTGCGMFLERLLNQHGVAVVRPRDPVDAIPDGAEISLDLASGKLTETSSGRVFALHALKPAHLAEITNA